MIPNAKREERLPPRQSHGLKALKRAVSTLGNRTSDRPWADKTHELLRRAPPRAAPRRLPPRGSRVQRAVALLDDVLPRPSAGPPGYPPSDLSSLSEGPPIRAVQIWNGIVGACARSGSPLRYVDEVR